MMQENPASLLGNPLRTSPAVGQSTTVPLFLDPVFFPGPPPTTFPYPFVPTDGMSTVESLANEQCTMDFEGPVTYMANWQTSNKNLDPPEDVLNAMAVDSGVSFTWKGKT